MQCRPLLTHEAIGFLEKFLKQDTRVLEFGCGRSTIWLAKRTLQLTSIESDLVWFSKINRALRQSVDLRFHNRPYHQVVDYFVDGEFDLIIVDGRDRVDCLKASIPKLSANGVMMLDDAQRPEYQEAKILLSDWKCKKTHSPQRDTWWWYKPMSSTL